MYVPRLPTQPNQHSYDNRNNAGDAGQGPGIVVVHVVSDRALDRGVGRSEQSNCSTRLNDSFPVQYRTDRLVGIESTSCCRTNDGSNGGEQIGAPL